MELCLLKLTLKKKKKRMFWPYMSQEVASGCSSLDAPVLSFDLRLCELLSQSIKTGSSRASMASVPLRSVRACSSLCPLGRDSTARHVVLSS